MTTAVPPSASSASAARFGTAPASAAPSPTSAPSTPTPPSSLDVAPGAASPGVTGNRGDALFS
ncbi:hypothetical protein [Actinomyces glycerinitolerans]|uniref:hypothetical protein n=1 Tax=Actinomyces glycerinitolerans TaxID=1892869 RepID=UPI001B8CCC35|nr:hypothetical protein [Actinomyces glycerinitolerans]